jgi:two-component system, OmpR family, response regulator
MKRSRPRVLIVDGNPDLRQIIAAALGDEGFSVATAADAPSALPQLASGSFAIVIAEMRLPANGDGIAMVQRARRRQPTLKALYISDGPVRSEPDPDRDSCITKPFKIREIIGCAWELYHRGSKPQQVAVPRLDIEVGLSRKAEPKPAAAPSNDEASPVTPNNPLAPNSLLANVRCTDRKRSAHRSDGEIGDRIITKMRKTTR